MVVLVVEVVEVVVPIILIVVLLVDSQVVELVVQEARSQGEALVGVVLLVAGAAGLPGTVWAMLI